MKKELMRLVALIFGRKVHRMEKLVGMFRIFQPRDRNIILLMGEHCSMILIRKKIL